MAAVRAYLPDALRDIVAAERVGVDRLSAFVCDLFMAAGVPEEDAGIATEILVYAQLRGSQAHGVLHMPLYLTGLVDGTIKARPEITTEQSLPCTRVMDADNALGIVASRRALDMAIGLAREYGLGAVAVRNSSHFGVAGYYCDYAADRGMISWSFSNASPAIAPSGGIEPLFGTNPIGVGFPLPDADPIVLDMATAKVARSRIKQAASLGEKIPADWALDPDGNPTTDPDLAVAGSVLPIDGPKGYGLALMTELLCSAVSDNEPGFQILYENQARRPSLIGQFMLVMNPEGFVGMERYGKRAAHIAERVQSSRAKEEGNSPRLPGARGHALERDYRANGIPVTPVLKTSLTKAVDLLASAEKV